MLALMTCRMPRAATAALVLEVFHEQPAEPAAALRRGHHHRMEQHLVAGRRTGNGQHPAHGAGDRERGAYRIHVQRRAQDRGGRRPRTRLLGGRDAAGRDDAAVVEHPAQPQRRRDQEPARERRLRVVGTVEHVGQLVGVELDEQLARGIDVG